MSLPRLGDIVLVRGPDRDTPGRFRVIDARAAGPGHLQLTGWYLDTDWLTEQTLHLPAAAIRPVHD